MRKKLVGKLEWFSRYAVTPFERLGWKHALFWGIVLGFTSGILISVVVNFVWTMK